MSGLVENPPRGGGDVGANVHVGYDGSELARGTVAREGPAARVLVEIVDEQSADEIVVGSRGHGALRAILGSVSHALLHESDWPVVIVRAKASEQPTG